MNLLPVILIAGVILLPLVWLIANYNRFAALRQHVRETWADIDVELKRRYDLIPNLVSTVKGYAAHERETLEHVTELRNKAAVLQRQHPRNGNALRVVPHQPHRVGVPV